MLKYLSKLCIIFQIFSSPVGTLRHMSKFSKFRQNQIFDEIHISISTSDEIEIFWQASLVETALKRRQEKIKVF